MQNNKSTQNKENQSNFVLTRRFIVSPAGTTFERSITAKEYDHYVQLVKSSTKNYATC